MAISWKIGFTCYVHLSPATGMLRFRFPRKSHLVEAEKNTISLLLLCNESLCNGPLIESRIKNQRPTQNYLESQKT